MISPPKKERLQDVTIIRGIAIIVVVAFHAYGMMYANHFPASKEQYKEIYYGLNQCGPIVYAMPLFVFISGYLYAYLLSKGGGGYTDFKMFAWNKFKRLIIPFWIFCSLMMITNRFFDASKLIEGSYSHLWFLPMLFWCFIICYILNRYVRSNETTTSNKGLIIKIIILSVSFVLMFAVGRLPKLMGLHSLPLWFFWFYLGYCIQPVKEKIIGTITLNKLYFPLFIVAAAIHYNGIIIYDDRTFLSEVAKLSAVLLTWYGINMLLKIKGGKWASARFLVELSSCSYGIYIFHNWIQPYMISRTAKNLLPLNDWALNHTVLFPLMFFLLSLTISYILAKITLKSRFGKFLIG